MALKVCPFCAEEIQEAAIRCKHCNKSLVESSSTQNYQPTGSNMPVGMTKRSPIAVALLPIVTLGISYFLWLLSTEREMRTLKADIPTMWLALVPFVSYYWMWKFSQGVELVTKGRANATGTFLLLFLLGSIGGAIVQDQLNNFVNPSTI